MSSPTGTVFNVSLFQEIEYRKIPKTSLSVYKPLPIEAPQIGNAKLPPLISPSEYKPPGACIWKLSSIIQTRKILKPLTQWKLMKNDMSFHSYHEL